MFRCPEALNTWCQKINIIKAIAININIAKSSFVRVGEKQNIESMVTKAKHHDYLVFLFSASSLFFRKASLMRQFWKRRFHIKCSQMARDTNTDP